MVHALHEAQRVLRPGGSLIDLRPARQHRRVGLRRGEHWQWLGRMREKFDDDRAADEAVAQVLREGLLRRITSVKFDLDRVMDTLDDFREWLDGFTGLPPHDWLVTRVQQALTKKRATTKIVVRGPLKLRVLQKRALTEDRRTLSSTA